MGCIVFSDIDLFAYVTQQWFLKSNRVCWEYVTLVSIGILLNPLILRGHEARQATFLCAGDTKVLPLGFIAEVL